MQALFSGCHVLVKGIQIYALTMFHLKLLSSGRVEYWIGLYKDNPRPREKSGWEWLDGQPYNDSMDLWYGREPSGSITRNQEEQCVRLDGKVNKWLDIACGAKRRFICKCGNAIIL